ncbi:MAG TPA: hypothetical protein PLU47_08080 [Azonexus sp.]|nr:hypothetical protein [Azonexus sp.]
MIKDSKNSRGSFPRLPVAATIDNAGRKLLQVDPDALLVYCKAAVKKLGEIDAKLASQPGYFDDCRKAAASWLEKIESNNLEYTPSASAFDTVIYHVQACGNSLYNGMLERKKTADKSPENKASSAFKKPPVASKKVADLNAAAIYRKRRK